ncbi:hypothetical protein F8G81_22735 [Arthrobacter sp. CDRTa11]|uniref:hypothetical protein n=1 Tax=Arthrobacter sp. CDRTa11 TaxID=2651199 RepID=UPI002265966B|nr:hypothetical protein [Arthrobacter sp. CDRTa11]UZX05096.1 hypothetical protein F8G81_22735 [Arthrobacter sp. CDRTa11]
MSSDTAAADMASRMARSHDIQQLAVRVERCTRRVEEVLAGFWKIQLLDWQSPAGRAYRDSVALQAAALGRTRGRLQEAAEAVNRHSRAVLICEAPPGGGY